MKNLNLLLYTLCIYTTLYTGSLSASMLTKSAQVLASKYISQRGILSLSTHCGNSLCSKKSFSTLGNMQNQRETQLTLYKPQEKRLTIFGAQDPYDDESYAKERKERAQRIKENLAKSFEQTKMYICGVLAFIISAHEARKMYAEHTQLEKIRPQASTQ